MHAIPPSELIINPDGSIFHLHVRPEDLASTVLLVGDPGRVKMVSDRFDSIRVTKQNREFLTHTGRVGDKEITVMSTGIGTDNIDIVLNELDALVNIDLTTRMPKSQTTSLNLIRLGTSGALQPDVPVDSFLLSSHGLGLDGLLHFYRSEKVVDSVLTKAFIEQTNWPDGLNTPYMVEGGSDLLGKLSGTFPMGITATACGFYGPQGRVLRLPARVPDLNERLTAFRHGNHRITNFEMETSALYGLGAMLGHQCATVCAIIANRIQKAYSSNYKLAVEKLIDELLRTLAD
jgi:uridine phosphorylase